MDHHDPIHHRAKRVDPPSKGDDTRTVPRVHTLDLSIHMRQNGVEQLLDVVTTGNVRPGKCVKADQISKNNPARDVDGEKAGGYLGKVSTKAATAALTVVKKGRNVLISSPQVKRSNTLGTMTSVCWGQRTWWAKAARPKPRVVASHSIQNSIVFPELLNWSTNRSTPAKRLFTNTTK